MRPCDHNGARLACGLAKSPSRRMLAREVRHILAVVSAVEGGRIGGGGKARADAEAVDAH
jgi:hypothetical protein